MIRGSRNSKGTWRVLQEILLLNDFFSNRNRLLMKRFCENGLSPKSYEPFPLQKASDSLKLRREYPGEGNSMRLAPIEAEL